MNDDDFKKNTAPTPNEGDARFDVSSLDEVTDENGNGIFHMTRRFKWILILSLLLLIANAVLIWAVYNDKLVAEVWQLALWCVCAVLAFYAVAKKSLLALILNLVLFLGVSLIPLWLAAHENIQSVIKMFSE